MSLKSKAKYSFLSLLMFAVVSSIAASLYSDSMYQEKMKSSTEEKLKHLPKILEDLKVIEAAKIFLPITFKKNSLELVSKHVGWLGVEPELSAASVTLFRKYPDFSKTEEGYQELIKDPEFQKFDVEWISSLEKYDHLDLTAHAHVKTKLDRIEGLGGIERVGVHSTIPLIDFMDLVNQATIFAIKKSAGTIEDKTAALKTLHHVAQLVVSSPSLVAQMVGVVALKREFFLSQKFGVTITPGLNHEITNRMKRVGFAWPGIISLNETNALPTEINSYMKPELMVCGAAGEIPFPVLLSDFLEPQWPFEPNFKSNLESSRAIYKKLASVCHTEPYLVYLKPIESNFFLFDWRAQNVPFVRRTVSSILMSIAVPSFMGQYQNLDEKRAPSTAEVMEKAKDVKLLIKSNSK